MFTGKTLAKFSLWNSEIDNFFVVVVDGLHFTTILPPKTRIVCVIKNNN